jgi:tRNA (cmo5U34)-methyltransferase
LIPCFDDFYNSAISVIEVDIEAPRVLDIGAGTGLFSSFLLKKYPDAHLTLIDISDSMLDVARTRFEHKTDVKYIVDDYSRHLFEEEYDIVISALSIHHLPDNEKQMLYKKCFSILRSGGIFVNAEQVLGETAYLDKFYKEQWKKSIEQSGLPREEILGGLERMKLDKETTVQTQLEWLGKAGFSDVACTYKYYNFAVLFGRKKGLK